MGIDIVDPYFGTEEWKARWEQQRKEDEYRAIANLLNDALLIAAERDMFSVNAILSVAIHKFKTLGISCNINGQRRLQYGK